MSTFTESTTALGTAEIHSFVVDFTDDLLSGVTVSSGTATHIPPSGAAGSVTCSVGTAATSGTFTLGPLSVLGVHYLDVLATLSDGEKDNVRIAFSVNYPDTQARSGMGTIIAELRQYAAAGLNDYTIANVPYWSDKQLQTILDAHRMDIREREMAPIAEYAMTGSGSVYYKRYAIGAGNLEQGTAYFKVFDGEGGTIDSGSYSVDHQRGEVTFTTDQYGSARMFTGYSYDLNAAAADVWRKKMAYYAVAYDISTDGNTMHRSQLIKQCKEMASFYESNAEIMSASMYRSDEL